MNLIEFEILQHRILFIASTSNVGVVATWINVLLHLDDPLIVSLHRGGHTVGILGGLRLIFVADSCSFVCSDSIKLVLSRFRCWRNGINGILLLSLWHCHWYLLCLIPSDIIVLATKANLNRISICWSSLLLSKIVKLDLLRAFHGQLIEESRLVIICASWREQAVVEGSSSLLFGSIVTFSLLVGEMTHRCSARWQGECLL